VADAGLPGGGAHAAVGLEQLGGPPVGHRLQMGADRAEVVDDAAQEVGRLVRVHVPLRLRVQQRLGLARVQPLGAGRRPAEGEHLGVLGQQRLLLAAALRDEVEAEAYQQQRRPPLHPRGAHDPAATSDALAERVEGGVHDVARQPLDQRVGPAQVQLALAHRQAEAAAELLDVADGLA
jgi:hypothetical protein